MKEVLEQIGSQLEDPKIGAIGMVQVYDYAQLAFGWDILQTRWLQLRTYAAQRFHQALGCGFGELATKHRYPRLGLWFEAISYMSNHQYIIL